MHAFAETALRRMVSFASRVNWQIQISCTFLRIPRPCTSIPSRLARIRIALHLLAVNHLALTFSTPSIHLLRIRLPDRRNLRREPLLKRRRDQIPIRIKPSRKRRRYLQRLWFLPLLPVLNLQVVNRFVLLHARCDGYLALRQPLTIQT